MFSLIVRTLFTALFASLLIATGVAQQKPAPAGRAAITPVTAKASLNAALAAAKKWQADAVLIQVVGTRVNPDGTRMYWDFGVYSASAKKCAIINVVNGQSQAQEAGGPECADPGIGDFIDSDKAMQIAKQNGLTKQDVQMSVSNSPHKKGQVIWMIIEEGMRNKGDLEIDIDAATGKVLSTDRRP